MNQQRWEQIIQTAFHDVQLRRTLAKFLANNGTVLEKVKDTDAGPVYSVRSGKPHIEEVDQWTGKHWVVKE